LEKKRLVTNLFASNDCTFSDLFLTNEHSIQISSAFANIKLRLPFSSRDSSQSSLAARASREEHSILGHWLRSATGSSANERLASALLVIAFLIAMLTAIVVIYQCGSLASSATAAKQVAGNYVASQHAFNQPMGKMEPFFNSGAINQYSTPNSQFGGTMDKLTAGQQTSIRSAQACSNNSMHHLSSTDNSVRQPNYGPNTTAKEYETQMLNNGVRVGLKAKHSLSTREVSTGVNLFALRSTRTPLLSIYLKSCCRSRAPDFLNIPSNL